MTFEELAYKEREMFAKINKVRSAQSDNLIASAQKGLIRQDYGQQKNRIDQTVTFRGSQSILHSAPRGMIGVKKKGNNTFTGNAKATEQHAIIKDKGGMETVSAGYNWDSGGYQERAKPTVLEKQGLLKPEKIPSLIRGKTLNGRHASKLRNANKILSQGN